VTYNLGLALAELGKRVLIVDADLHNPNIHVVSQLPNVVGLSTAIATDQPWQKLIHSSRAQSMDGMQVTSNHLPRLTSSSNGYGNGTLTTQQVKLPHLHSEKQIQRLSVGRPDILTAGPSPLNPIAWLSSARMGELLEEWAQAYDYVLIDTPPVVGVADAQSLAAKVDGVVLVVGVDQATRPAVTRAVELLSGTGCNIPGVVVNLVDRDRQSYGHPRSYGAYYGKSRPDIDAVG
jgi:Mrp family chromosome partitioning ATPase